MVWIPGYWIWNDLNDSWDWVTGTWRAPPPGQRWVPGYWTTTHDGGLCASAVFGFRRQTQRLAYLPAPPPPRNGAPTETAGGRRISAAPGNWEYRDGRFVWKPGYVTAHRSQLGLDSAAIPLDSARLRVDGRLLGLSAHATGLAVYQSGSLVPRTTFCAEIHADHAAERQERVAGVVRPAGQGTLLLRRLLRRQGTCGSFLDPWYRYARAGVRPDLHLPVLALWPTESELAARFAARDASPSHQSKSGWGRAGRDARGSRNRPREMIIPLEQLIRQPDAARAFEYVGPAQQARIARQSAAPCSGLPSSATPTSRPAPASRSPAAGGRGTRRCGCRWPPAAGKVAGGCGRSSIHGRIRDRRRRGLPIARFQYPARAIQRGRMGRRRTRGSRFGPDADRPD